MGKLSGILHEIKVVVTIPLFLLAGILFFALVFVCLIVRSFVWALARIFRPDLLALIREANATFITGDPRYAAANIVVTSVWDGSLEIEHVRADIKRAIFTTRDKKGRLIYERLTHTWTSFLGFAFWKVEEEFDLNHHVRLYDYSHKGGAPVPPREEDLNQILSYLLKAPWNPDRSPWEVLLVPLTDENKNVVESSGNLNDAKKSSHSNNSSYAKKLSDAKTLTDVKTVTDVKAVTDAKISSHSKTSSDAKNLSLAENSKVKEIFDCKSSSNKRKSAWVAKLADANNSFDAKMLMDEEISSKSTKSIKTAEFFGVLDRSESENSSGAEKGKMYQIMRYNHILGDGYSVVGFIKQASGMEVRLPELKVSNIRFSTWQKCLLIMKMPYDVSSASWLQFCTPKLKYEKNPNPGDLLVTVSSSVSVDIIKQIKNYFRVHYGIVIYSAIYGAIGRALKKSGQKSSSQISSGFILPLPNHPGGAVIHAALVLTNGNVKDKSAVERLLDLQGNVLALRRSTIPLLSHWLAKNSGGIPIALRSLCLNILSGFGLSWGLTVFPVTIAPDFYEGHELVEFIAAMSPWSDCRMTAVCCGVNNQQRFTFAINKSVFASKEAAERLGDYVLEEIQELLDATL